jgi:hypothetical protein
MHNKSRFVGVAAAFALVAITAAPAQAQFLDIVSLPKLGVGVVGSTLGLGGDVTVGFGSHIVLRGAKTGGSIGVDQTFQSQAYNIFAKADNESIMLDIHPFGGGLYVSVGKVMNHSKFLLTGQPSGGTYTFNGNSYPSDSVGTLSGSIKLPDNPLFFGFGWDHTLGNSWPVSLTSRVGVLHQDKVQLDLSASGPYGQQSNPAHTQFQAELDAERTKQEQSINEKGYVKNLPVVELAIRVRLF